MDAGEVGLGQAGRLQGRPAGLHDFGECAELKAGVSRSGETFAQQRPGLVAKPRPRSRSAAVDANEERLTHGIPGVQHRLGYHRFAASDALEDEKGVEPEGRQVARTDELQLRPAKHRRQGEVRVPAKRAGEPGQPLLEPRAEPFSAEKWLTSTR